MNTRELTLTMIILFFFATNVGQYTAGRANRAACTPPIADPAAAPTEEDSARREFIQAALQVEEALARANPDRPDFAAAARLRRLEAARYAAPMARRACAGAAFEYSPGERRPP